MSFRDYLHEKAQESRHNETEAYLMFVAGAIFLVGGMLETLSLTENPSWLLLIPYSLEPRAGGILGLALMISGFSLIVYGIAAGIHYSHDRRYMQELQKPNSLEDALLHNNSTKNNHKKKNKKVNSPQIS